MKTYSTFRSTLSNVTWATRGTLAILAAAILAAFALAWQPNLIAPAAIPAARQAAPAARNPYYPVTGLPNDGAAYVSYLAQRPAVRNPNRPVIGTGSAYDGGSYVTAQPAVRNPDRPAIGTGSAYDGQ